MFFHPAKVFLMGFATLFKIRPGKCVKVLFSKRIISLVIYVQVNINLFCRSLYLSQFQQYQIRFSILDHCVSHGLITLWIISWYIVFDMQDFLGVYENHGCS